MHGEILLYQRTLKALHIKGCLTLTTSYKTRIKGTLETKQPVD